jgi:hypothetical protein
MNGFPTYDCKKIDNTIYHWKHSIPSADVKKINERVIDVCIFRNLEDWLISMYHNPYHMKRTKGFDKFLTTKNISTDFRNLDYRTNACLNADDNGKTIFEIRYHKFKGIMEYAKMNKDVIFVNLEFLQNETNLLYFLKKLNSTYMARPDPTYLTKIPHTKNKKLIVNREYTINAAPYQSLIDKYKNKEIEKFINDLKLSTNIVKRPGSTYNFSMYF